MAELTKGKNGRQYKTSDRAVINSMMGKNENSIDENDYVAYFTEINWSDITPDSNINVIPWKNGITSLSVIQAIEYLWKIIANGEYDSEYISNIVFNLLNENNEEIESNEIKSGSTIKLIITIQPIINDVLDKFSFKITDKDQFDIENNEYITINDLEVSEDENKNELQIIAYLRTKAFYDTNENKEFSFWLVNGSFNYQYDIILTPTEYSVSNIQLELNDGSDDLIYNEETGQYELTIIRENEPSNISGASITKTISLKFLPENIEEANKDYNINIENKNIIPTDNNSNIITCTPDVSNSSLINITTGNNNTKSSGQSEITIVADNGVQTKLLVNVIQKPVSISLNNNLTLYSGESVTYNNVILPDSTTNKLFTCEEKDIDYADQYLTIVSLANNNTIKWKAYNSSITRTISISTDNGVTWSNPITSTTSGTVLGTLSNGQKMLIKGSNTTYGNESYYNYFISTQNFNVEGNIMSLIYGDDFAEETTIANYSLRTLFYQCTKLVSAENLILPATTLKQTCYRGMFNGCTSLTTAPKLPATILAQYCYHNMFSGCKSLTKAPELPATTLTTYCYQNMFSGCTSLTKAPELPATTLAQGCYENMFSGCTKLRYIKCLATNISITGCLGNWTYGVALYGTFIYAKNNTPAWPIGESGIPSGWRICSESEYETIKNIDYKKQYLTIVSLSNNNQIRWNCDSNYNYVTTISISTNNGSTWHNFTASYQNNGTLLGTLNFGQKMIIKGNNTKYGMAQNYDNGFRSSGKFNVYGNIMSLMYGDNFVGQTTLNSNAYSFAGLFYACPYLISAKNLILPSLTLTKYCYYRMFRNCTSLTIAPELPATTLTTSCYERMFDGCTNLKYIKALFTTTPSDMYTQNWVTNVASTGIFVKNDSARWTTSGVNGVPNNWSIYKNSQYTLTPEDNNESNTNDNNNKNYLTFTNNNDNNLTITCDSITNNIANTAFSITSEENANLSKTINVTINKR